MTANESERIELLERRLRHTQGLLLGGGLLACLCVLAALTRGDPEVSNELRTRRLVVVDDKGVARVVIGQDPADTQRRSRGAGITIHDATGAERGGMITMDDKSVVLALDAPTGVGNPMRDRIGMMVAADGGSSLMLIDNETKGVVKLISDGKGWGGTQVFKWDDEAKKVHVKTIGFDGEKVQTQQTGK
jgi:hypothetical protein